jgi:flagellar biosynthesis GTPase FlhF
MKEQVNELLRKIGLKAVEVKLEQIMTADGQAALEAEVFEAGQPVFIVNEDERIPLPVGEYEMAEDMILKIEEEGIIASFEKKEMEEEAAEVEAEEKEMEEVAASEEPTATPVAKKVVESVSKETYFSAEERESLIAELKAQILAELSKEDKKEETTEEVELSKPIQHNPENAQPREQISFNKKEQSLKSMVYDLISK